MRDWVLMRTTRGGTSSTDTFLLSCGEMPTDFSPSLLTWISHGIVAFRIAANEGLASLGAEGLCVSASRGTLAGGLLGTTRSRSATEKILPKDG